MFNNILTNEIMEQKQKNSKKRSWWKPVLAGATCIVLGALGYKYRNEIKGLGTKAINKAKKNFKKASDAPKVISDNISDQPVRRPENHGGKYNMPPYSERFKKFNS